jgi:hypothetical protein
MTRGLLLPLLVPLKNPLNLFDKRFASTVFGCDRGRLGDVLG